MIDDHAVSFIKFTHPAPPPLRRMLCPSCAALFLTHHPLPLLSSYIQAALIRVHKHFAFVLFGARRPLLPALAEAPEAMEAPPLEELPLVGLNHHGYYHGIIMKRLVAGYAGAPWPRLRGACGQGRGEAVDTG